MRTFFLFLLLSAAFSGHSCNHPNRAPIRLPSSTPFLFPRDSNRFHFPEGIFGDKSYDLIASYYSLRLRALEEPVLYSDTTSNEIYRFTWLRSFHSPLAVRIEKQAADYNLYWKLCEGAGDPGDLWKSGQKAIGEKTWNRFKHLLSKTGFWEMPVREKGGKDGAQWILEGKSPDGYHVVDRWSPEKGSAYYKCCDFLLGLTDVKIMAGNKY